MFAAQFPWAEALGYALTGRRLGLASTPRPNVVDALRGIEEAGFGHEEIAAVAAGAHAEHEPWPYPLPAELAEEIGAATFVAMLADAKSRLGIDQPPTLPLVHRRLDADERRLSAELPPHHGHVG